MASTSKSIHSEASLHPVKRGANFVGFRTWATARFVRPHVVSALRADARHGRLESIVSRLGHAKRTCSLKPLLTHLKESTMPSLIAYRKAIDSVTTHTLRMPEAQQGEQSGQEIAILPDGRTVVALFDGHTLPSEQPAQIAASIETLPSPLPDDLRDAIKAASPHVRLINQRVQDAITQRYSLADEIKLLRTAPSPEMDTYNAYTEECRAWGRTEKAKLGL